MIVSRFFRFEIEALGGYDTRETGTIRELKQRYPSSLRPEGNAVFLVGIPEPTRCVGKKRFAAMIVGITALAMTAATRKEYCSSVTKP